MYTIGIHYGHDSNVSLIENGKCLFAIEKYCHYLFIFGGYDGNKCTNDIFRYDFITDKWDIIGNLIERRTGCFSILDEPIT